jgi:hypothetical protein
VVGEALVTARAVPLTADLHDRGEVAASETLIGDHSLR